MKRMNFMMILIAVLLLCAVPVIAAETTGEGVTPDTGFSWMAGIALVATMILGYIALKLPTIAEAIKELAQAFKVLGVALEDNKISADEASAIKKEFVDVWKVLSGKTEDKEEPGA